MKACPHCPKERGACSSCANAYDQGVIAGRRSAFRSIARWARKRAEEVCQQFEARSDKQTEVITIRVHGWGVRREINEVAREAERRARGAS